MTYHGPTLRTVILTASFAVAVSAIMAFSRPVEVMVDGQRVESDVSPVTTSAGNVYVPVRSIADALGAETLLEGDHVEVVRGAQTLRVHLGDTHATLNGMPMTLKHAPFRVRGRVMIAVNAIARAFGVRAVYDSRTARVDVVTSGVGELSPDHPTPH